MSTYICPRCNYTTSRKSNIRNHIIRKNLCKPTHKDVSIKSIADTYGIELPSTDLLNVNTNVYTNDVDTKDTIRNVIGHKEYICKYCSKSFNSSTSRCRHQRKFCKFKNKDKEITITQEE